MNQVRNSYGELIIYFKGLGGVPPPNCYENKKIIMNIFEFIKLKNYSFELGSWFNSLTVCPSHTYGCLYICYARPLVCRTMSVI